ncbi:hypothetical protein HYZ99_00390, partial [Candidatus Peregrinibacteria bacterium]|nr:hypothetical protein [Candidatus Peregrinibacteria bacterium]
HPEDLEEVIGCWHEHCAAQKNDDKAAKQGGEQLFHKIGLPTARLRQAGFSNEASVQMKRDIHIHPGQGFAIDATKKFRFNGHKLGLPLFELAATGIPPSYLQKEVALTGKIIDGPTGMGEVMGPDDRLLGMIAADSRDEAAAVEKTIKPALQEYARKPEIIHLIHGAA